jgi:hypothetical protein
MCHPALLLEEIIQLVFSWLSRRGLAAAARTCVAWKEPALDMLWKATTLPDLLRIICPLLMCGVQGWDQQYVYTTVRSLIFRTKRTSHLHLDLLVEIQKRYYAKLAVIQQSGTKGLNRALQREPS